MSQRHLNDHHHVRALLQRPLVLRGGLAGLDARSDGAAPLCGEHGALAGVVEEQLLTPALKRLISGEVLDDRRARALASDQQGEHRRVAGCALIVEQHRIELRDPAAGDGHEYVLSAHEEVRVALCEEVSITEQGAGVVQVFAHVLEDLGERDRCEVATSALIPHPNPELVGGDVGGAIRKVRVTDHGQKVCAETISAHVLPHLQGEVTDVRADGRSLGSGPCPPT